MADEKQVPLDELLFGQGSDPRDTIDLTLAEAITACYREGLAKSRRDHAAQKSSLSRPPGGPER